jgi:Tfp pilus assembly protein PilX
MITKLITVVVLLLWLPMLTATEKRNALNERRRQNYQKNKRRKIENAREKLKQLEIEEFKKNKKRAIEEEFQRRERNRIKSARQREKKALETASGM